MEAYEHPASSPILQKALKSALPHSINLVYRTNHPNRTPDAHVLATFPENATSIPHCWAAAYLDRSMRPETELWIFASGENPSHKPPTPAPKPDPNPASTPASDSDEDNLATDPSLCSTCKTAVLALVNHMATFPLPPLRKDVEPAMDMARQHEKDHPESGPDVRYPPSEAGLFMRHLLSPSVVTLGGCHSQVVELLDSAALIRREFPGVDSVLNKFIFKVSDLPQTRELPEGLRWGKMRQQDIEIVKSRTAIPRSTRTLMSLESVGVFDDKTDTAVAWAFLGLDGSLTTLHTEPEFRGRGIAKAVAARLFSKYAPELAVDDQGVAWAHGDVYKGNMQSEAVCRSLGGNAAWKIYWVRIDLASAGESAQEGRRTFWTLPGVGRTTRLHCET